MAHSLQSREISKYMSKEERSVFWEAIVSVIPGKKVYSYVCPIPNGFRDRAISLYSSRIVEKKEILRTVSNTGIYCSIDKVGTVYLLSSLWLYSPCGPWPLFQFLNVYTVGRTP
jgi:hypothetical protein